MRLALVMVGPIGTVLEIHAGLFPFPISRMKHAGFSRFAPSNSFSRPLNVLAISCLSDLVRKISTHGQSFGL